jgi:hypothetical protein
MPASPVLQRFESCYELAYRFSRRAPITGPATLRLGAVVSFRGLSSPSPKLSPSAAVSHFWGAFQSVHKTPSSEHQRQAAKVIGIGVWAIIFLAL